MSYKTYAIDYHIICHKEGEYNHFGPTFSLSGDGVFSFVDWLRKSSTFKMNANFIVSNFNFISYAMIYESNDDNDFYAKDDSRCITREYLEENNPDILKELKSTGKQSVVGYMMTFQDDEILNEGFHAVDICESRVKKHNIMGRLIDLYEKQYDCKLIPMSIKPKSSAQFWYDRLDITDENSLSNLIEKVFKRDTLPSKYVFDQVMRDYGYLYEYIEEKESDESDEDIEEKESNEV